MDPNTPAASAAALTCAKVRRNNPAFPRFPLKKTPPLQAKNSPTSSLATTNLIVSSTLETAQTTSAPSCASEGRFKKNNIISPTQNSHAPSLQPRHMSMPQIPRSRETHRARRRKRRPPLPGQILVRCMGSGRDIRKPVLTAASPSPRFRKRPKRQSAFDLLVQSIASYPQRECNDTHAATHDSEHCATG